MMYNSTYLQFSFAPLDHEAQERLLAELNGTAFDGFEQQEEALIAYVAEPDCDEQLRALIQVLQKKFQLPTIQEQRLAPQNWNAEWERNYTAVLVDDFCVIRADFHPPVSDVEHEILITPKMSFGTGHHATTYMMLQLMREIDFKTKRVLDYGCGTGVLAIMAAYLGAQDIVAVDYDYWAYENSIENIARNTNADIFQILEGDWAVVPVDQPYDIILANINRNVILESMKDLAQHTKAGGVILCSGFLEKDLPLIIAEAERHALILEKQKSREKWWALRFSKAD